MTTKVRHAFGHDAQLHIFTVPFDDPAEDIYVELFQGVIDFLKANNDSCVLALNGPYLEDEDTLALDLYVDNL